MLLNSVGFSLDDREFDDMLSCVDAPVLEYNVNVLVAISASGFYTKDLDIDYISRAVIKASSKISRRFSYKEK